VCQYHAPRLTWAATSRGEGMHEAPRGDAAADMLVIWRSGRGGEIARVVAAADAGRGVPALGEQGLVGERAARERGDGCAGKERQRGCERCAEAGLLGRGLIEGAYASLEEVGPAPTGAMLSITKDHVRDACSARRPSKLERLGTGPTGGMLPRCRRVFQCTVTLAWSRNHSTMGVPLNWCGIM